MKHGPRPNVPEVVAAADSAIVEIAADAAAAVAVATVTDRFLAVSSPGTIWK
jgi:hypothetical protein